VPAYIAQRNSGTSNLGGDSLGGGGGDDFDFE